MFFVWGNCVKRSVIRVFVLLAIGVLLTGCRADFIARKMLFQPERLPVGWNSPYPDCEEAVFVTESGESLHGLYFLHPNAKNVVLFSHGNAGNVDSWGHIGMILRERLGVSVLVYDYRGYGKSEGIPSADGILADARAARKWLARREGIPESEIVQMGRSLGGAVAIDLAAKDGAKALLIESTFTSLPDMSGKMFPLLPAKILLKEQLSSIDKIGEYHGPYYGSHGMKDTLIPFEQGRRLYENVASERKIFQPIEEADHNDQPSREYYENLAKFLDSI